MLGPYIPGILGPKGRFQLDPWIFRSLGFPSVILVNKSLKALCLSSKMVCQHLLNGLFHSRITMDQTAIIRHLLENDVGEVNVSAWSSWSQCRCRIWSPPSPSPGQRRKTRVTEGASRSLPVLPGEQLDRHIYWTAVCQAF